MAGSIGRAIFPIPTQRDLGFNVRVDIQDRLLAALRRYCQALPDRRTGKNTSYAMADFTLAALPRSSCKARPSWRTSGIWRPVRAGRTARTLFGIGKIPGDSQIRAMLDPIEPALFYPMFADIVAELEQCGGLEAMRVLNGNMLIALDGTEFHCSDKIHCPNCSHRKRGKDKIEYFRNSPGI